MPSVIGDLLAQMSDVSFFLMFSSLSYSLHIAVYSTIIFPISYDRVRAAVRFHESGLHAHFRRSGVI